MALQDTVDYSAGPMANGNIAQFERAARKRLSDAVWHYLQEGAGQGTTLHANLSAWGQQPIIPRPLEGVRQAHTRVTVLGETWEHPFVLAPIAYQSLFHAEGESAAAMAANAQGGQMLVSSLASQPLEQIIQAAQQPLWFQLYWQGERLRTLRLAKRAMKAGYRVMVFTVDAPVKQANIVLPAHVRAVNLEQPLQAKTILAEQSMVFEGWMSQAPTWEDVKWLRDQIDLPLVLKGLLHPQDALNAVECGCDGVVVSNHGGRVLDGAPDSVSALKAIVDEVAGRCVILVDSGLRSGQDAYRAIRMGADAVLIGRPYIWGLAAQGAMGVAQVIRCLRDELELTMALTGVSDLQSMRESAFRR